MMQMRHCDVAPISRPRWSAGNRPACTSEDFPLPELPTTAMKRFSASRRNNSAVCVSRP
jgi:hypothetical protein